MINRQRHAFTFAVDGANDDVLSTCGSDRCNGDLLIREVVPEDRTTMFKITGCAALSCSVSGHAEENGMDGVENERRYGKTWVLVDVLSEENGKSGR